MACGSAPCSAQAPRAGCEDGYRRAGALRDFALGRGWTVYADCAHPERPRVAVAASGPRPTASGESAGLRALEEARRAVEPSGSLVPAEAAPRPDVEPGSSVRLWRRDGVAAVELAGKALESGSVGSRIRVKAAQGGAVLRGTVRAAGSVELDPPGSGGFRGDGG